MLLPEIERQQAEGKQVTFGADPAFARPRIHEAQEERGVNYVIRIPANKNLEMEVAEREVVKVLLGQIAPVGPGSTPALPAEGESREHQPKIVASLRRIDYSFTAGAAKTNPG